MRSDRTILRVAHVTVQLRTPLSVAAGGGLDTEDAPIVRDVYGLPAIPATSIAGVLRSAYAEAGGRDEDGLFGFSRRDSGQGSRLEFSNGFVHASDDTPATRPTLSEDGVAEDDILRWYQEVYRARPLKRRRTRISPRGVAEKQALFDRTIVARGTRFTFEIAMWSDPAEEDDAESDWQLIGSSLAGPAFRLGAGNRSGLGAVDLVRRWTKRFDLANAYNVYRKEIAALQTLSRPTSSSDGSWDHCRARTVSSRRVTGSMEGSWRVGGGDRPVASLSDPAHEEADLVPLLEAVLTWPAGGSASRGQALVISGAGMKGALRHRTAFHYDRLRGRLLDPDLDVDDPFVTDDNPAVIDLFGIVEGAAGKPPSAANARQGDAESHVKRGRVVVDDIFVALDQTTRVRTLMHNSIDRFSGGVRDGALFSEQMIWGADLTFEVVLLPGDDDDAALHEEAFELALDDLLHGRLALGAAAGRGHGRFSGSIVREESPA